MSWLIGFNLAVLLAGLGAAGPGRIQQAGGIERARWLSGCWLSESRGFPVEEHWMAPLGHTMLAVGRTVRRDRLLEYEIIILREAGAELLYEAHPSGQISATFRSVVVSDSQIVFRNPDHDYPQEIGYRRAGRDSLVAWTDGQVQGRARRIEFPYRRTSCTPP
jgi:uncharacterized protein DUF6265